MIQSRKMRFSIDRTIVLFLLILSIFTCYISYNSLLYGLVSIITIGLIFIKIIQIRNLCIGRVHIVWLLTLFPLLLNNYSVKIGEYGYTLRYIAIIFYILVASNINWKEIKFFFSVYRIVGMIFSVATILFYFVPDLYYLITPKLIPGVGQTYGYNVAAGLTYHYSYNTIIISVAIMCVFADTLFNHTNGISNRKNYLHMFIELIAMGLTGKRSVPVYALLSILITLYLFMENKKNTRTFVYIGIMLFSLIVFTIISNVFPYFLGVDRLFDSNGNLNMSGRYNLYLLAIQYFLDNKLFGIGWGHFRKLSGFAGLGISNLDVHNVYLNLLCEVGITGFLIFMIAFFFSLVRSYRIFLQIRKNMIPYQDDDLVYISFSVCIQSFFLIYCVTGNPLYDAPALYPYMVSIGIIIRFLRIFYKKNKKIDYLA